LRPDRLNKPIQSTVRVTPGDIKKIEGPTCAAGKVNTMLRGSFASADVGGQAARIVLQAMRDVRVALGKHGFDAAMVPARRDVEGATVHDGFPQAFIWLMGEVSSAAVAGPRDYIMANPPLMCRVCPVI
jgi:hypothetical protein